MREGGKQQICMLQDLLKGKIKVNTVMDITFEMSRSVVTLEETDVDLNTLLAFDMIPFHLCLCTDEF